MSCQHDFVPTRTVSRNRITWRMCSRRVLAVGCGVVALLAQGGAAPAAEGRPQNPWSRSIVLPDGQDAGVATVALDARVYAASRSDLADLRLVDDLNQEVAFRIRRRVLRSDQAARHAWDAVVSNLHPADDRLEFTIRLQPSDPPVEQLTVSTRLQNFEHQIRVYDVESPDADTAGAVLLAEGILFDYSQYLDARNLTLKLPPNTARTLRIVIDKPTTEQESELKLLTRQLRGDDRRTESESIVIQRQPFRIDRIQLDGHLRNRVVTGPKKQPWSVLATPMTLDAEQHVYVTDITTDRQPISEFNIGIRSSNFSRRVTVNELVNESGEELERPVGSGTLHDFEFNGEKEQNLTVSFPVRRAAKYRLRIEEYEGAELVFEEVTAVGEVDEIVWLADHDRTYGLLYGAEQATPPRHDLVALDRILASAPAVTAEGRFDQPIPLAVERATSALRADRLINNPWVLGSGILVLVVLLTIALVSASRRIDIGDDSGSPRQND